MPYARVWIVVGVVALVIAGFVVYDLSSWSANYPDAAPLIVTAPSVAPPIAPPPVSSPAQPVIQEFTPPEQFTHYPYYEPVPSVKSVPGRDLYETCRRQYWMRADERMLAGLRGTPALYRTLCQASSDVVTTGTITANNREVIIPVLRNSQPAESLTLSLPNQFADVLRHIGTVLAVVDGDKPTVFPEYPAEALARVEAVRTMLTSPDPLQIIAGLDQLEEIQQSSGMHPCVIRATCTGYTMLYLLVWPDSFQMADSIAARALALLAICRRIDPGHPMVLEEAVLAHAMGYTRHAREVASKIDALAEGPVNARFKAFMTDDWIALQGFVMGGSTPWDLYLGTRYWRERRYDEKAREIFFSQAKLDSIAWPAFIEGMWVSVVAQEQVMSVWFAVQVISLVLTESDPARAKDAAFTNEIAKGLVGRESTVDLSFRHFHEMLAAYCDNKGYTRAGRCIIDAAVVRGVIDAYFYHAMVSQFEVFHKRIGADDTAGKLVELIRRGDPNEPFGRYASAQLELEAGRTEQGLAVIRKLMSEPAIQGMAAYDLFLSFKDIADEFDITALIAQRLDGRPMNIFWKAELLTATDLIDESYRHFMAKHDLDPYEFMTGTLEGIWWTNRDVRQMNELFKTLKDDNRISALIAKHYMNQTGRPGSLEKALTYFDRAMALQPEMATMYRQNKAWCLKAVGRYNEAEKLYKKVLGEMSPSIARVMVNIALAEVYYKSGQKDKALEELEPLYATTIAGVFERGVVFNAETGNMDKAEALARQGVNRFPTTGHVLAQAAWLMWKQGRHKDAAYFIARGRTTSQGGYAWYATCFEPIFESAPDETVFAAVDALIASGASQNEVMAIASYFFHHERCPLALELFKRAPLTHSGNDMFLAGWLTYAIHRTQGADATHSYVMANYSNTWMILVFSLIRLDCFDIALDELRHTELYEKEHEDHIRLTRLATWMRNGGKPAEYEPEVKEYYTAMVANRTRRTDIDIAGLYLLNQAPYSDLMPHLDGPDRWLVAFYTGLKEQFKGNYEAATVWYRIVLELNRFNFTELHIAHSIIDEWAKSGITRRPALYTNGPEVSKVEDQGDWILEPDGNGGVTQ
ncbi:MAG: tetratricopeptide repeat protein [Planctomycetota bacterium]